MADLKDHTITITGAALAGKTLNVAFTIDEADEQNLSIPPEAGTSKDIIIAYVKKYAQQWLDTKEQEAAAAQVPDEVTALIGQVI